MCVTTSHLFKYLHTIIFFDGASEKTHFLERTVEENSVEWNSACYWDGLSKTNLFGKLCQNQAAITSFTGKNVYV